MSTNNNAAQNEVEEDPWTDLNLDEQQFQQLLDATAIQQDTSRLRVGEQHAGFDDNVGDTWIYPNNLTLRSYQFNITQAALYRNTLVVLPTGLGKTFIAAVVMYNLYRWYPTGKVIFMAPTRPLVAQQIEACQKIMPFPSKDIVELTGKLQRDRRLAMWRSKRVFFATPQVVQSDLSNDFPFAQVKLLVIDEAHKAKGRYAYTEVTQAIWQRNRYFRVLALSATPGRTMEDVAEVVRNLYISHLEVRCDASIDVRPYVHQRHMKTIVVPLGEEISELRAELLEIIDPYLRQLIDAQVLSGSLTNINRNFLLYEQKRFREHTQQQQHPQQSMISTNFSICISLYHALELLERHGMRVFLNNFEEDEEGRTKFIIAMDGRLRELIADVRKNLGPNPFDVSAHAMTNGKIPEIPKNLDFGHPKFEHARRCLVEHFEEHPKSRAIVFCEYRESVMLIYRLLLQHAPLLKPRCFVGQGGTTGSLRALSQKQQIQIMADFRAGKSNILIATSIGEEGIDVGEVDLIVCFDISTSNPTRFIQRIGRTGRQKQGNVLMLVTEGREQQLMQDVLKNKDQTNRKLLTSSVVRAALYQHAPRLVPTELKPQCVHTFVRPPEEEDEEVVVKVGKQPIKNRGRPKKEPTPINKAIKGSQDLRNFFQKSSASSTTTKKPTLNDDNDDDDEMEIFQLANAVAPTVNTTQKQLATSASSSSPTTTTTTTQINTEKSLNRFKDYFHDLETLSITPTNTQLLSSQSELDLAQINKILRSWNFLKVTRKQTESIDLLTLLKSDVITKKSKLSMLKFKMDYIRNISEQMKVLKALEMAVDEPADVATTSMSKEELEIRETYAVLEDLLEGGVEAYLESLSNSFNPFALGTDDDKLECMNDVSFNKAMTKIFGTERNQSNDEGFFCDNFDYWHDEFKKTQRYQEFMDEKSSTIGESMVYNTLLLDETDETMNNTAVLDSRYCSQWDEFAKRSIGMHRNESTPLPGPLGRAFSKQQQQRNLTKSSRLLRKLSERMDEVDDDNLADQDVICISDEDNEIDEVKMVQKMLIDEEVTDVSFKESNKIAKERDDLLKESNLIDANDRNKISNSFADHSASSPSSKNDSSSTSVDALQSLLESFNSTMANLNVASSKTNQNKTTPEQPAKQSHEEQTILEDQKMLSELDIDLDAFMEPFSEEAEQFYTAPTKATSSQKENQMPANDKLSFAVAQDKVTPLARESPDLFALDDSVSKKIVAIELPKQTNASRQTLAAKLAARCNRPNTVENIMRTPPKQIVASNRANICHASEATPIATTTTTSTKYETSPCIMNKYLKQIQKHGKLSNSLTATQIGSTSTMLINNITAKVSQNSDNEDTLIQLKPRTSKRKIFDSDTETEEEQNRTNCTEPNVDGLNDSQATDCDDEIAASQLSSPKQSHHNERGYARLRRKHLRRQNPFVLEEATVSGSEQSEDEVDKSLDDFVCDSIVAPEDEENDDDGNVEHMPRTQMHAVYLQSLKSPRKRHGAFKIPEFRVYNDHAIVYSQAVPIENSQYELDSFIVPENERTTTSALDDTTSNLRKERSMCPLERAEKILKERRRRAKRAKYAEVGAIQKSKRRKVCLMESSSEDEVGQ